MAFEVEEAFPSFSTERLRSKVQSREGAATQRRLDYNAPLLSVRRLAADAGGSVRSKVWKLSGELSKEPLRIPGAVPFTWEHSPGRPKSPPREPSSPSPPSTPSPPSARRASPASPNIPPPAPPLRPLFLRFDSSTLFAPPPPPPPPPFPRINNSPPPLTLRTAPQPPSSSVSRPKPPPPPPPPPPPRPSPHLPTPSHIRKQASSNQVSQRLPDHERMGAFRLVDPTEGFLRLLRARREKSEPQEFLAAEVTGEVDKASHKAAEGGGIAEVVSSEGNSSCVAVDAIVRRFLAEHPDVVTEEEACLKRQEVDQDAVNSVNLSCEQTEHDVDKQKGKDVVADGSHPCSTLALKEDAAYISVGDEAASEEIRNRELMIPDGLSTEYVISPVQENGGSMCAPVSPSAHPQEVLLDAGRKHSVIQKQQNRRFISSVASLDVCRAESLRMIKSALLQFFRKAAAASMRAIAKARQNVAASGCVSHSLEVVVHPDANRSLNQGHSDRVEEAVAREGKTEVQEQFPEMTEHQEALAVFSHSHPITPPRSSTDILQESSETVICDEIDTDMKPGCTLILSPRLSAESSLLNETEEAEEKDIVSFSPNCSPNAERTCRPISSHNSSSTYESNEAELTDIVSSPAQHSPKILSSPPPHSPNRHGSPGLRPHEREGIVEARPRASSARHVYAKSLGGDEPSEFYDASSRFGSWGSTPSRLLSNRSMSKDWSTALDDFLDATSSPFETPRTSVSDIRYTMSNGELTAFSPTSASKFSRQTSKLSKRVGKSLWVDTREINPAGKVDAVSDGKLKSFISGELYTASKESERVLSIQELNGASRKCVSGDQASTSTAYARRQYRRGAARQANGKMAGIVATPVWSAARQANGKTGIAVNPAWGAARQASDKKSIAVTPVFPSKCQKNRSIASASGLPQQMSTGDMEEMGWPLGISGYPPLKVNTKVKEARKDRGAAKGESNLVVPLPPLPASPAGGSWLRKALSTTTQKQGPSGIARMPAVANKKAQSSPRSKWEDIVKGSHFQPGHLRFSEELHHHPPSNSTSNKYFVS